MRLGPGGLWRRCRAGFPRRYSPPGPRNCRPEDCDPRSDGRLITQMHQFWDGLLQFTLSPIAVSAFQPSELLDRVQQDLRFASRLLRNRPPAGPLWRSEILWPSRLSEGWRVVPVYTGWGPWFQSDAEATAKVVRCNPRSYASCTWRRRTLGEDLLTAAFENQVFLFHVGSVAARQFVEIDFIASNSGPSAHTEALGLPLPPGSHHAYRNRPPLCELGRAKLRTDLRPARDAFSSFWR